MPDGICSVHQCVATIYCRGFCQPHYQRDRSDRAVLGPCSLDGCDRPSYARNLCARHYKRLLTTGSLELRAPRSCDVLDCERLAISRNVGLCRMHSKRLVKFGRLDKPPRNSGQVRWGEDNTAWLGEDAGYNAIHIRLRHLRGPASTHSCVDCGSAARQWSYDHASNREQVENGKAFTTDLDHYFPRCVSCHKRFDLRA